MSMKRNLGHCLKSAHQPRPDDDLDTLIGLSTGTDLPVIIKSDNKAIGVVSKDTLLRGLQGGNAHERCRITRKL